MTPADVESTAEQVFGALADPSRRAVLAALSSGGPRTVTELAAELPITRQATAKHLAKLVEVGLVAPEPGAGRRVRYRLQSAPMRVAQQFLAALARDWDSPLGALKQHLDRVGLASSGSSAADGDDRRQAPGFRAPDDADPHRGTGQRAARRTG